MILLKTLNIVLNEVIYNFCKSCTIKLKNTIKKTNIRNTTFFLLNIPISVLFSFTFYNLTMNNDRLYKVCKIYLIISKYTNRNVFGKKLFVRIVINLA